MLYRLTDIGSILLERTFQEGLPKGVKNATVEFSIFYPKRYLSNFPRNEFIKALHEYTSTFFKESEWGEKYWSVFTTKRRSETNRILKFNVKVIQRLFHLQGQDLSNFIEILDGIAHAPTAYLKYGFHQLVEKARLNLLAK